VTNLRWIGCAREDSHGLGTPIASLIDRLSRSKRMRGPSTVMEGGVMLGELLFQRTALPAVKKSLDAAMLRSRVIGNNIANVNTPGYHRLEVSFEEELREALDRTKLKGTTTDAGHMPIGRKDTGRVNPSVERPVDQTLPSGVNNVDIDTEMAKLAENQILFNYGIRFARGAYRKLNAAIQARSLPLQQ